MRLGSVIILSLFLSTALAKSNIPRSPLTGLSISYESKEGQQCMSRQVSGGQADKILNRYGTRVDGYKSSQFEQGVATTFSRIADLGRPDLVQGVRIEVFPGGRNGKCSSFTQSPKHLQIVVGSNTGCGGRNLNKVATSMHIAHEMGHAAGQKLGLYGSMPKCNITGYCTHNNSRPGSEAFAEAFAMFIHSPQTLKSKCASTYNFIKQNVFKGRDSTAGLCKGIPATAIAGGTIEAPPSGQTFSGSAESVSSGYNGGGGAQIAGLAQALMPLLASMKQNDEGDYKDVTPEVIVIPRNPAGAPPNINGNPPGVR